MSEIRHWLAEYSEVECIVLQMGVIERIRSMKERVEIFSDAKGCRGCDEVKRKVNVRFGTLRHLMVTRYSRKPSQTHKHLITYLWAETLPETKWGTSPTSAKDTHRGRGELLGGERSHRRRRKPPAPHGLETSPWPKGCPLMTQSEFECQLKMELFRSLK